MMTLLGSLIRLHVRRSQGQDRRDSELTKAMQRVACKGRLGGRHKREREADEESSESEEAEELGYELVDRDALRCGCLRNEDRVEVELWLNKH